MVSNPPLDRRLEIPADLGRLSDVRALIRDLATATGAPAVCSDDLVQAVDEAVTNIIVHGYAGASGTISIDAALENDILVVTIADRAPSFDPTTRPEPDMTVPALRRGPGGMGIHLMRLATDTLEYRPRPGGGNILTLTRTLDPRPKEDR